uniref:Enhancer of polycomb-like protein n=1 Tax=Homalodisca liturata TaxID=320908 RepID=A0A1B6I921_9HEMI
MSKPSFRARPLEASKPMPIFMSEELPDLPEYSAINRAVPQMPSGMKKEEECEHHLQRAIVTGLIIPTPEVIQVGDMAAYNRLYAPNFKVPKQLIHMQPFTMEQDIPDYDMDSEDERWLDVHSKTMDINALKFEEMMDRLEKNSGHSVVTQMEAKVLLKEDDDLIIAVYDYWLNKRLKTQQSLIPCVKTEAHRGGNSNNNPYLAFRRRTEKMQTRKNRKNDESTYEKMVKLKRNLSRAVTLLELVKRRENSKRELLHLTVEIFEKRFQAQDFSGQLLAEVSAMKASRPAFAPLFTNQFNHGTSWSKPVKDEYLPRKEKRQYKKRKHKNITTSLLLNDIAGVISSGDDDSHNVSPTSPTQDEAPFAFRRKRQCVYHAPVNTGLGNWPWCSRDEGGLADQRFRFNLASVATPVSRCVGLARRRVGRGGRVILDRAGPPMDDFWSSLDFTIQDNSKPKPAVNAVDSKLPTEVGEKLALDEKSSLQDPFEDWPHFRPKSPLKPDVEEEEVVDLLGGTSLSLVVEDLNENTSELTPVNLNISELFPTLSWEGEELARRDDTDTLAAVTSDAESSEDNELNTKNNLETELRKWKNLRMEYRGGGSLLDRWARFESPPPEPPVKKPKPLTPEPTFNLDDFTGCSAFRTSNCWSESKLLRTLSDSSEVLPSGVSVEEPLEVANVITNETSNLPPTPPKETKTPPPPQTHRINNLSAQSNGPVSIEVANSRLLSKHIGSNASYRKKNNHLHSHGLNNKLIMRLPENTGDILETTVVSSQVISDKNTNEALMRKATQVPMEVT